MKLNYASLNNKEYERYSIVPQKIKEEYQQEEENIQQEESISNKMQSSEEEDNKLENIVPTAGDLYDQIRSEVISSIPEEESKVAYSNKPGKLSISSKSTTKKTIGTPSKFLGPSQSKKNKLDEEEIKSKGGGLSVISIILIIILIELIYLYVLKE